MNMLAAIEPFYRLSLAMQHNFHREMFVNNKLSPLTPSGEKNSSIRTLAKINESDLKLPPAKPLSG